MATMTASPSPWAADDLSRVAVKNTFVHLPDDTEDDESGRCRRRRLSVPASIRLAGIVAGETPVDLEASTYAGTSADATLAAEKESASLASTAANTPVASPRQPTKQSWADMLDVSPLPPDPDPSPQPESRGLARTRLSARAASWRPAGGDGAEQLVDHQVALVMEQLQATLARDGATVKIEIHGADMGQRCLVLWIRSEDAWMREGLLAAAKQALLDVGQSDKVFVLGHQGRPFTPQTHGFSGMLATVEEKTHACWALFKEGHCRRGAACLWHHPTVAYPVNVVVVQQTESLVIHSHGITTTGLCGGG